MSRCPSEPATLKLHHGVRHFYGDVVVAPSEQKNADFFSPKKTFDEFFFKVNGGTDFDLEYETFFRLLSPFHSGDSSQLQR